MEDKRHPRIKELNFEVPPKIKIDPDAFLFLGDPEGKSQTALMGGGDLVLANELSQSLVWSDAEDEELEKVESAGGPSRHSESKKEMLKVVANNINRLMKEVDELDKISRELTAAEKAAEKEVERYDEMLKYVNNIATDDMTKEEWQEFFNKYFVRGEADQPESASADIMD